VNTFYTLHRTIIYLQQNVAFPVNIFKFWGGVSNHSTPTAFWCPCLKRTPPP